MKILVADDSQTIRRLLTMKLKEWNHEVIGAKDGLDAWNKLLDTKVDLVLTDWIMPQMDGVELCRRIRNWKFDRYIYIILTSVRDSQQDLIGALEAGADDYIPKPIDFDLLNARIKIGQRIIELDRDVRLKYEQIKRNYSQTIHMFTNFIEVFNADLAMHSRRVASLSLRIAKEIGGLSQEELELLEVTALLHDVGMIGLPNGILNKKRTEMTGEERELYLSHPVRGELILEEIEFLKPVARLVRMHHEQFNGRGFPDGLPDEEIPLLAKIVSVASIYDNIVYRGKVSFEDVPKEIERMSGYQIDPKMAEIILRINLEKIQEEKKKNFVEIPVHDLKSGDILAENLHMIRGALILPVDTVLTEGDISKLLNYKRFKCIKDRVRIYKKS